jgi:hypothetical protein
MYVFMEVDDVGFRLVYWDLSRLQPGFESSRDRVSENLEYKGGGLSPAQDGDPRHHAHDPEDH